jgi:hypothetical protein
MFKAYRIIRPASPNPFTHLLPSSHTKLADGGEKLCILLGGPFSSRNFGIESFGPSIPALFIVSSWNDGCYFHPRVTIEVDDQS